MRIFESLIRGEITQIAAAKKLRLSARQIRNKLKKYKKKGIAGLVHENRGRSSPRRWNTKERDKAMSLFDGLFEDFGPTFAAKKLETLYGIFVSKETLRKEMIKAGKWFGKKRRQQHRIRRARKLYFGEIVQLDGSDHDWFEGRDKRCTALVYIDDATSALLYLKLVPSESTESLSITTKEYFEKWGLPNKFYVDYGSVFSVNTNNPDRVKKTQFGRAMQECGVEIIFAHSPQAKGRVERANGTLQDHLVKELRLAGISTMDAANDFIRTQFIDQYNERFAKKPLGKGNIHRLVDGFNFNPIFCLKEERVVQNDWTIRYKNRIFQIQKDQNTIIRPRNHLTVLERFDGAITLKIRKTRVFFSEIIDHAKITQSNDPWRRLPKTHSQHPFFGKNGSQPLISTNT